MTMVNLLILAYHLNPRNAVLCVIHLICALCDTRMYLLRRRGTRIIQVKITTIRLILKNRRIMITEILDTTLLPALGEIIFDHYVAIMTIPGESSAFGGTDRILL